VIDLNDDDYADLLPAGLLVPHYLIHCYLYYVCGTSLISDRAFDFLAKRLQAEWDLAEHPNRRLIDRAALSSGGHYLTKKLPLRVQSCAEALLRSASPSR
jgi:hypothetical protein